MTEREQQLQAELDRAIQVIQSKDILIQRHESIIQQSKSLLERNEIIIKLQEEKIRSLLFRLFGPKSDKITPDQGQLLLEEVMVVAAEVEAEGKLPPEKKEVLKTQMRKPRSAPPGRNALPEHLERREKIIPCHPKDCTCEVCGADRPVVGYDVSERLCCEAPKFYVEVVKLEKRGSHCLEEQGVATAPTPARIVPKGKLGDSFIIDVLMKKFQLHQPVFRQCADLLENHGIDLSRETVNQALLAAGELLIPVNWAMREELIRGSYIQADETPVACQTREKRGRNHRAYMWEYSRPGGVVVFDFRMSRGREGPREFLKGFCGKLQCDGYSAYEDLGEGITCAGCMSHMRRNFVDLAKIAPDNPIAPEIVEKIAQLYAVEKEARLAKANFETRKALRQQKSVPLMAELKARLIEIRQEIPPGGKLAQACDYALNQWSRLEEYLQDGEIEIDNNWCEGAMRPVALGRKNWLHIGSEQAGAKIAAIASIVETCRRLEINLRDYLNDILPRLGDWPINRVGELTPTAWKAAKS